MLSEFILKTDHKYILMIDDFFFSIAGKKSTTALDDLILTAIDCEYVPKNDKRTLEYTRDVALAGGHYPAYDYYAQFYTPATPWTSLGEIKVEFKKILDFYKRDDFTRKIMGVVNEATSSTELVEGLTEIMQSDAAQSPEDLDEFVPVLYSDRGDKPESVGIISGIGEIDALTNGFQPGTIASICAFTGHGKSITWNSIAYRTAKAGKKVLLCSIEMPPEMVWPMFQTRFLNEECGMSLTTQDLIFRKLSSEQQQKVNEFDSLFKERICKNLMVVDESVFSKTMLREPLLMQAFFRKAEKKLEGLDLVVFDHVNQFNLMYEDMGNTAIRTIQQAIKTYRTFDDTRPVGGFAVQANREGFKHADRHHGEFTISAIGDMNEIERSSVYIIFLYTPENEKLSQQTKVTMLKHRLGSCLVEPTTVTFAPNICTVGSTVDRIEAAGLMGQAFEDLTGGADSFDVGVGAL